ncbi:MAG: EF-P lysine aminoacylase EpmA [Pseudomonadota bacterium]
MADRSPRWRPSAGVAALKARAAMLRQIREFFFERGVLEVTTPVLSRYAISTPGIESFGTSPPLRRYLRTSPELALKRLLCAGVGDVFEIGPVFRMGEQGRRHNPEFTLLEWYRIDWNEHDLMHELGALLALLLKMQQPARKERYVDLVYQHTGIDVFSVTTAALREAIECHTHLPAAPLEKDALLDLLFATAVAPQFECDRITFVHDYPASQAALAALSEDDPRVARRFEAYLGDVELANGFFELRDSAEQRDRFGKDNAIRSESGAPIHRADASFLAALAHGLPRCAGVAVGVDRLLKLALAVDDIAETMAFGFDLA